MSVYVIGDVHGCYQELHTLFKLLNFNSLTDRAIFVGDLIGRGPNSLEVIDFVMDLGNAATVVLGNHDIKFLSLAHGFASPDNDKAFNIILNHPRLNDYLSFLASLNLMHIDEEHKVIVTHAGIPPVWDSHSAIEYALLFKEYKTQHGIKNILKMLCAGETLNWHSKMTIEEIIQYTAFGFTKMKYCFNKFHLAKIYQCAPGEQPENLTPWFLLREDNQNNNYRLFFGHWAALGFYKHRSITCCDSGCVWGGKLTAINISEKSKLYQVDSRLALVLK